MFKFVPQLCKKGNFFFGRLRAAAYDYLRRLSRNRLYRYHFD